jgi:hypothetical protein
VAKPTPLIKNDFSAGEISPRIYGRVDFEDFARGLKTCKNWIPFIQGPLQTRPGTRDIEGIGDETARGRLIPFKFGTEVSYALQFNNNSFRAFLNNNGNYEKVDLGTRALQNSKDVSAQDSNVVGVFLSTDGTSMYMTGQTAAATIYQYTLSTAWDLSTASFASKSFDVSSEGAGPFDLYIRSDGAKLFVIEGANTSVFQYTLSTPWDISTASYDSKSKDISAQETGGTGLDFKSDGTAMYIVGIANDTVYQYTLSTAWDVSTATFASKSKDVSSEDTSPTSVKLTSDGLLMYVSGTTNDKIYKYTLATAYDVSTATYDSIAINIVADDNEPQSIFIRPNDAAVFVAGNQNDTIFHYSFFDVTTPYTTAQLQDIQYIQSNDVLYLAHPSHPPRKILRTSANVFSTSPVNFLPPPTSEIKEDPATTLALTAVTGTGITATAGAATFLTSDVNKTILAGPGRAFITAFTNATTVTIDIIDDFDSTLYASGDWSMKGTPYASITPSAKTPFNATITLDSGAVNTFRNGTDTLPTDVGKYVYLNDGVVQITAFNSATNVDAKIIKELSATTATFSWTMEQPIWNATDGYPSTVTFHQDRLIWAGSTGFPQTIAASVTGDYENHARGTADADAFLVTLNAREVNTIEWILSRQDLIVGTTEAEWAIQSSTGLLTPSDIAARLQTAYGSKSLRPAVIDGSILFFQRLGRKLRELTFDFNVDGYTAPEMSLISEHITEGGMEELSYQQSPMSILWMVRSDGQMVGFTFDKRAGAIAWHRHIAGGVFDGGDAVIESVASIPHPTDDYDELWIIVKRTINNSTSRRIEVMTKIVDDPDADPEDYWQLDSGKATAISASDTITGLGNWEGETLTVINRTNGGYLGTFTVSSGEIDLGATYTATMLTGYQFNSDMELLQTAVNAPALGQGQRNRLSRVHMQFYKSMSGQAGPNLTDLKSIPMKETGGEYSVPSDADLADPPDLVSDWRIFSSGGTFAIGGEFAVRQHRPFPMTILTIVPESELKSGSSG